MPHDLNEPVDQATLKAYFSPYDQSEKDLLALLASKAQLSHEVQRATTASAITLVEAARAIPNEFSLRQVFCRYPIQSAEGQTLFQLITQLCHITDKQAQQGFIHECFACAAWMKDHKRRDRFFSTTSSWGLSLANRFFSGVPEPDVNGPQTSNEAPKSLHHSITQKFARRFGSPIMHKTIMQAVTRLTDPLIYGPSFQSVIDKNPSEALHLRPGLNYGVTPDIAMQNQAAYFKLIDDVSRANESHAIDDKPSIHLEIHHFSGPFDLRQTSRMGQLIGFLTPIVMAARQKQVLIIIGSTSSFSQPILRYTLKHLLPLALEPTLSRYSLGVEISAAEPSSIDFLEELKDHAALHSVNLPVRLTKERSKPCFESTAAIHLAYIALASTCLRRDACISPRFVTHNAFTLACVYHLAEQAHHQDYEIHHRYGVGLRCQQALQENLPCRTRIEAPLGAKHDHHHMILQRLREITDPNAFLNRMYDENTTTAGLVVHPSQRLKLTPPKLDNFWRHQIVKPHLSDFSTAPQVQSQELTLEQANERLNNVQPNTTAQGPSQEQRWQQLKTAHEHACQNASVWVKLFVDHIDMPRHVAELHVEAALQQQARLLRKPLTPLDSTFVLFPRGQTLLIGSAQRPLSPLLEQITRALLLGNRVFIKPASATLTLIEQVLQSFWLAGFDETTCACLPLPRDRLQTLISTSAHIDSVVFDGLQPQAKSLAKMTLNNTKQPPIPFYSTPASSCVSTQGMCLIDETASDQELNMLASDAWKLGPMIILVTPGFASKLQTALLTWRDLLIIGDTQNRDTHLSLTQSLQPFPINLAPICKALGLQTPTSICAPEQSHPFFQIMEFSNENLVPLLQALGQDAQINRFTLLTRMPVRIKTILDSLPAHEIHLGWPRDHTSFVFRGVEQNAFALTTHILRHQRLHPWTNNGTFDITDL